MTLKNTNFHSSGLRQAVDQLMDILWSGGVNNPMDSIEQLSYLIFLRLLSEKDDLLASMDKKYKRIFAGAWAKYAWGNFVTLTGDALFNAAREAIEKLHELPGMSETGKLLFNRATLKIYDRPTLRATIQAIHGMDLEAQGGLDLKGDMYEYLLGKLAASGTNGQFRTPRHIIDMIVKLVNPQPGQRICDPAAGTAGFLIAAFNHILNENTKPGNKGSRGDALKSAQWKFLEEQAFTGYDNDANMVKIAILNLYLHGLEKANIQFFNPLTTSLSGGYPGQLYAILLANPPFSGAIQKESILADINLNTRDTEKLFAKWFIDHLAPGGRAGVIVPDGVIIGNDASSKRIRHLLITQNNLEAVISLPPWCFKPYARVATFILVFRQGGKTERTWMYRVNADGYSPDSLRSPISENDFPDLLQNWEQRNEAGYRPVAGKHGWVSAQQLTSDLELAPRLYLKDLSIRHGYSIKKIREICNLEKGTLSAQKAKPGPYPLVTTAENLKSSEIYQFDEEAVCVPLISSTGHGHASMKRVYYVQGKFAAASIVVVLHIKDRETILAKFLYYFLQTYKDELFVPLMKGAANISLSLDKIGSVDVPVPPVDEQQRLIHELDSIDCKIDSQRAIIETLISKKEEAFEAFKMSFL